MPCLLRGRILRPSYFASPRLSLNGLRLVSCLRPTDLAGLWLAFNGTLVRAKCVCRMSDPRATRSASAELLQRNRELLSRLQRNTVLLVPRAPTTPVFFANGPRTPDYLASRPTTLEFIGTRPTGPYLCAHSCVTAGILCMNSANGGVRNG